MASDTKHLCYYFAYGSNMNPERMRNRGVRFVSRDLGKLPGYSLAFNKKIKSNGTAAANIVLCEQSAVYGALYGCKDDHVFQQLDRFEGVKAGQYYREEKTVVLQDGKPVQAFVYIAHENSCENDLSIHPDYLAHLLAGKDILPEDYFNFLNSFKERCSANANKNYFAYGADMDASRMEEQGIRFVKRELGILPNYKLCFNKVKKNGMLAPNIDISKGSHVYGAFYTFKNCEPFQKLDKSNGAMRGHYHRCTVKIHKENGEILDAETYIANPVHVSKELQKIDPKVFMHVTAGTDILPNHYVEFLSTFKLQNSIK